MYKISPSRNQEAGMGAQVRAAACSTPGPLKTNGQSGKDAYSSSGSTHQSQHSLHGQFEALSRLHGNLSQNLKQKSLGARSSGSRMQGEGQPLVTAKGSMGGSARCPCAHRQRRVMWVLQSFWALRSHEHLDVLQCDRLKQGA